MHKITLLCIGSVKMNWAKEACTMYSERLEKLCSFTMHELADSKQNDIQISFIAVFAK